MEEVEDEIAAEFDAKTVNALRQKIDFEINTVRYARSSKTVVYFHMILVKPLSPSAPGKSKLGKFSRLKRKKYKSKFRLRLERAKIVKLDQIGCRGVK